MVTNKKSGFCKSTFDNLQETSIYNVAIIVNDTNVMRLPLSLQTIIDQLFVKQSNS